MKNFIKLHEVDLKKSKEVPDDENIGNYSDILVDVYKNGVNFKLLFTSILICTNECLFICMILKKNGQTTQIEFKDLNNEKKIIYNNSIFFMRFYIC